MVTSLKRVVFSTTIVALTLAFVSATTLLPWKSAEAQTSNCVTHTLQGTEAGEVFVAPCDGTLSNYSKDDNLVTTVKRGTKTAIVAACDDDSLFDVTVNTPVCRWPEDNAGVVCDFDTNAVLAYGKTETRCPNLANALVNIKQGDVVTFYRRYSWHNAEGTVTFRPTQAASSSSSVVTSCTDPWADSVVSSHQGTSRGAIPADRTNPQTMIGDLSRTVSGYQPFFSLGFGGDATLAFTNFINNGAGNDLTVYEATTVEHMVETASVYVSQDGSNWILLGTATNGAQNGMANATSFDLGSLPWAKYVKLVETSNIANAPSLADGFDVNAVTALHADCNANANTNLTISKTGPATVQPGTVATYQVTVTNVGTQTANNVQLNDTIPMPAGTIFLPSQSDSRCAQSGNAVICQLGSIAAGSSQTVQLSFQPPATAACGPQIWFKNTANVSATNASSVTSNMVTSTLVCPSPANLSITKTGPQTVQRGQPATYTVTVTNNGPSSAPNVRITDAIPTVIAGTAFVPQQSDSRCVKSGANVVCSLGTLASGQSEQVQITFVTPAFTGTPIPAQSHTYGPPEYVLREQVNAIPGHTTIPGYGTGRDGALHYDATTATASCKLLQGQSAVAAAYTIGHYTSCGDNTIAYWTGSDYSIVGACGNNDFIYALTCNSPAVNPVCTTTNLTNTAVATINGTTAGSVTSNTVTTTVTCGSKANLSIQKFAPATAIAGSTLFYQISVTNAGPDAAENVIVTDAIPAGLTFLAQQSDLSCTQQAGNIVCALGTVAVGAPRQINLAFATVVPQQCQQSTVTNTASVTSTTPDDNTLNNTSSTVSTRLDCPTATLTFEKIANQTTVNRGGTAAFTLRVHNTSNTIAQNIVVTDPIPTIANGTVTFNPAASSQACSLQGQNVVCTASSLGGNQTIEFIVAFTVGSATDVCTNGFNFVNQAFVTATGVSAVSSNVAQSAITCSNPSLSLQKSATQTSVTRGGSIVYSLVVTNSGDGVASNVVITDPIPTLANGVLTFNPSGSSANCGLQGVNVVCAVGSMNGHSSTTVTITFTVGSILNVCSLPSNIINTASVSAQGVTAVTSNPVTTQVNCPAQPNLSITKTPNQTTLTRGSVATYTITVSNTGAAPATNVVITDPVPTITNGTVTFAPGFSDNRCTLQNGTVSCALGTVNAGSPVQFTIGFLIGAVTDQCNGTPANVSNVVYGTATGIASVTSNVAGITANCAGTPNLSITKTGPTSVQRGQTATYTITVTNSGNAPAQNVSVSDTIGVIANGFISVQSKSTTQGTCQIALPGGSPIVSAIVSCDLGTVQANSTAVIQITLLMGATTDVCTGTPVNFTNSATLAMNGQNVATSNIASTTVTCVGTPSLTIQKTANQSTLTRGAVATYVITVTNTGTAPATNVTVTDPVPTIANGTVTFAPNSSDNRCTLQGGNVICSLGTLNAGATSQFTIGFLIGAATDQCNGTPATVSNIAAVAATNVTAVTSNTASITANCAGTPSLTIQKTANQTSLLRGAIATYNITVANTGNAPATNVTVTDAVPSITNGTVTFAANSSDNRCTLQGGNVVCALGTINANSQIQFTVAFVIGAVTDTCNGTPATVANTASVTATGVATVTSNTASITANCAGTPSLSLQKTANSSNVTRGGTITYTLTATNNGSAAAQNVTITDPLPTITGGTVTFNAGASSQNCTLNGSTVTCSLGTLAANGGSTSVQISVTVGAVTDTCTGSFTMNNIASIAATGVASVNSNTSGVTVNCPQAQTGCIDITKYAYDYNGNLITSVPQFTFTLDGNQTTVNNSAGKAQFTNVTPGTHTVTETVPSTWTQQSVTPPNGTVQVIAGASCVGVQFNNKQNQIIVVGNPTISKTDNRTSAAPGEVLTYVLTVTNPNSTALTNVSVVDPLSSLLTYISSSNGGVLNGSTVTWSNLTIPANNSITITLQAQIVSSASNGVIITNVATVNNVNSSSDVTVVQTNTTGNLTISITDSPDPVRPCDNVNYYIQLTNPTSQTITTTVDQIFNSSDLSFVSASDGGFQNGNGVRWTSITIGANATRSLSSVARVNCSAYNNETLNTTVTANGVSASTTTTVNTNGSNGNQDFAVRITADKDPVRVGDTIEYTIRVTNNGNQRGTTDVILDLDSDTSFLDATSNGRDSSSDQVIWRSVSLDRYESQTFRATVRVRSGARNGQTLTADVRVTGDNDSVDVRVRDGNTTCTDCKNGNGTVSLSKLADRYEANPGDEVTYTIMVRNTSGEDLTGIQIFDTFPSDMLQITDAGGGSASNGSISWTIDVNNGLTRTLVYRARISGAARAGNVIHNNVIAQGGDLNSPANSSADVRILGYLPQTGASDYTSDLEDTSRFLRPFGGATGSGFGGMAALFSVLGVSGLGFLTKRYFF